MRIKNKDSNKAKQSLYSRRIQYYKNKLDKAIKKEALREQKQQEKTEKKLAKVTKAIINEIKTQLKKTALSETKQTFIDIKKFNIKVNNILLIEKAIYNEIQLTNDIIYKIQLFPERKKIVVAFTPILDKIEYNAFADTLTRLKHPPLYVDPDDNSTEGARHLEESFEETCDNVLMAAPVFEDFFDKKEISESLKEESTYELEYKSNGKVVPKKKVKKNKK